MGRKPTIDPKNLPPWFVVEERPRPSGKAIDKVTTFPKSSVTYIRKIS
jgi:hypothetical protein